MESNPWPFASGHTVRPALSSSTSASEPTTQPSKAKISTLQLPLHASGIDTELKSSGERIVWHPRVTAARTATGDRRPTDVLGLKVATADTSLQYDSQTPAGLPVELTFGLEPINQRYQ